MRVAHVVVLAEVLVIVEVERRRAVVIIGVHGIVGSDGLLLHSERAQYGRGAQGRIVHAGDGGVRRGDLVVEQFRRQLSNGRRTRVGRS